MKIACRYRLHKENYFGPCSADVFSDDIKWIYIEFLVQRDCLRGVWKDLSVCRFLFVTGKPPPVMQPFLGLLRCKREESYVFKPNRITRKDCEQPTCGVLASR